MDELDELKVLPVKYRGDLEIVTALTTAIDKIQRDDCTYADFEKAMKWLDRVIKNLTEATETQKAKIT